ncbi:MAG: MraY family glycosyltransferase [Pseudanabaenaceae cyanobacterium bins.68]|nr:MraY family glycosyltransferase [Pseudanabaenaceae cyanobacterium bins.68]
MPQTDAIPYLAAFMISAFTVWFCTPIVRRVGLWAGITDQPNERKMHSTPIVRLGGVGIFLGSLIALLIAWRMGWFVDEKGLSLASAKEYEIWGVTIGGLIFFLLGLADDLFDLPALVRLAAQIAIATLAWVVGVRIDFVVLPWLGKILLPVLVSLPLTVVWLAGMVNAINWIDGLDGLAAGVSAIAAAVLLITSVFMKQPSAALIAAALAGGCLGFLRYNFKPNSPAEIFMGDGGAYYLGFTLAGVSIIGVSKGTVVAAVVLPYMILAVPIVDGCAVIIERLRQGKSPFSAGNQHLHHRLVKAGVSKRRTVLFIYALTLWLGSLALAFSGMPAGGTYAVLTSGLFFYFALQVWQNIHHSNKG